MLRIIFVWKINNVESVKLEGSQWLAKTLIFKTSVLGKVIPFWNFYFSILIFVKKICCYAFLWVFFGTNFINLHWPNIYVIINLFSITPLYFQVSFMSSTSLKVQLSPWYMAILLQKVSKRVSWNSRH